MKFYGGVRDCRRNKGLHFDSNPYHYHYADCPVRNPAITQQMMSEILMIFSGKLCNGIRSTWLKIGVIWDTTLTLHIANPGNMGIMSCLGGGLCSLSALVQYSIMQTGLFSVTLCESTVTWSLFVLSQQMIILGQNDYLCIYLFIRLFIFYFLLFVLLWREIYRV